MDTDERIRNRKGFRAPMMIWGIGIAAFCFGLGLWMTLDPAFQEQIPSEYRHIFAGLLLSYGLYRGWRVYADNF